MGTALMWAACVSEATKPCLLVLPVAGPTGYVTNGLRRRRRSEI
jgi:hypothetical protein